jgi:hypothetical protein
MSELSRRGFIGSAAAAASLVGLTAAADEEFSFKNIVPDPLLAGTACWAGRTSCTRLESTAASRGYRCEPCPGRRSGTRRWPRWPGFSRAEAVVTEGDLPRSSSFVN